jgi:hypothetical protein
MKKMFILGIIFFIVCASALFISCEKQIPMPKAFIGSWGFDSSTFENDPKLKQMMSDPKAKQAFDVIAKAFESLSVVVTPDTFSVDMSAAGSQNTNKKFAYKITAATEGDATLVNKSQGASGGRYKLQLIDANHIKMINIIKEDQPMETLLVRK